MRLVAESFAWPFRGAWPARWLIGMVLVLLLPVLFVPLLGYAIAATRAAELSETPGPPPWRISGRLLSDGFWTSLAVAVTVLPFALLLNPLAAGLNAAHIWSASDAALASIHSHVLAFLILALPWGLLTLIVMPHATARFAASGKPADLFNYAASWRDVSRDFVSWNIAAAAIVTAWIVGLACAGLLCVGILPGVFYAILVSAHAAATLHPQDPSASAR
ncbi:MAG TPA: DUF4013 domain-containing protein [Candidatus Dormibacteraeota bacterium]|nr:DUF4013 domain-containing protein [Candidatus Dormibacteraeota bacterium]